MRKVSVLSVVVLLFVSFSVFPQVAIHSTGPNAPIKSTVGNPTVDSAPPTPVDPPAPECEEFMTDDGGIGILCTYPVPFPGPFPGLDF